MTHWATVDWLCPADEQNKKEKRVHIDAILTVQSFACELIVDGKKKITAKLHQQTNSQIVQVTPPPLQPFQCGACHLCRFNIYNYKLSAHKHK